MHLHVSVFQKVNDWSLLWRPVVIKLLRIESEDSSSNLLDIGHDRITSVSSSHWISGLLDHTLLLKGSDLTHVLVIKNTECLWHDVH